MASSYGGGYKRGRDDDHRRQGGGHQRQHHHGGRRGGGRQRGPDLRGTGMTHPQYELKCEVVRLGDGVAAADLADDLVRAAEGLSRRLPGDEDFLARVLVQCGAGLPGKAAVYGTLVGLLNPRHPHLAARVVRGACAAVTAALEGGDALALRQLLRFLAELANARAVAHAQVLAAFGRVCEASGVGGGGAGAAPAAPTAADAVAYAVLTALPSAARAAADEAPEGLAALLERVGRHAGARPSSYGPFLQLCTDAHNPAADTLTSMWRATQRAREDGWPCASAPRPYEALAERLEAAERHPLVGLERPPAAAAGCARPRPDFRLHDDAHELNAGVHPVDRVLACDVVADLVVVMRDYHKEAAAAVLALQMPFSHLHLLVETFFSLLFQLPEPAAPPVQLGTLMVDLFKAAPATHPVVGRAINAVFHMVESLDAACRDRFVTWFAYHISHFQYMWAWPAWTAVLEMPECDMRRQTVRQVLEAASRLGFWDRVAKTLPEPFRALMPPKPRITPPAADAAGRAPVLEAVRARAPAADVLAGLRARHPEGGPAAARALVSAMLVAGHKSFSHVFTLADRYGDALRGVTADGAPGAAAARLAAVECVAEHWASSLQHPAVIVGRLQRLGAVRAEDVAAWALSRRRFYFHYALWDTLTQALDLELGVTTGRARGGARVGVGRAAGRVDDAGAAEAEAAARAGPRAAELFAAVLGGFARRAADDDAAGSEAEVEHGTTPQAFLLERAKCVARRYWRVILPHADGIEAALRGDGMHPEVAATIDDVRALGRAAGVQ